MLMNSNQVVFLDTSLQIERMIGTLAQQEALETHLARASHRFVSSHYVFMEFQRAVLSDYVRVTPCCNTPVGLTLPMPFAPAHWPTDRGHLGAVYTC